MSTTSYLFFFFNDTATTEIYTLSLHDALPICRRRPMRRLRGHQVSYPLDEDRRRLTAGQAGPVDVSEPIGGGFVVLARSGEHTAELPSQSKLVCRPLLGKKKKTHYNHA